MQRCRQSWPDSCVPFGQQLWLPPRGRVLCAGIISEVTGPLGTTMSFSGTEFRNFKGVGAWRLHDQGQGTPTTPAVPFQASAWSSLPQQSLSTHLRDRHPLYSAPEPINSTLFSLIGCAHLKLLIFRSKAAPEQRNFLFCLPQRKAALV